MTMDGVAVADWRHPGGCSPRTGSISPSAGRHECIRRRAGRQGAAADRRLHVAGGSSSVSPLSTFQTVAAQLAEGYIASPQARPGGPVGDLETVAEDLDAGDDLGVLGCWVTIAGAAKRHALPSPARRHGDGRRIDAPLHSTIKDLAAARRASHRLPWGRDVR